MVSGPYLSYDTIYPMEDGADGQIESGVVPRRAQEVEMFNLELPEQYKELRKIHQLAMAIVQSVGGHSTMEVKIMAAYQLKDDMPVDDWLDERHWKDCVHAAVMALTNSVPNPNSTV